MARAWPPHPPCPVPVPLPVSLSDGSEAAAAAAGPGAAAASRPERGRRVQNKCSLPSPRRRYQTAAWWPRLPVRRPRLCDGGPAIRPLSQAPAAPEEPAGRRRCGPGRGVINPSPARAMLLSENVTPPNCFQEANKFLIIPLKRRGGIIFQLKRVYYII